MKWKNVCSFLIPVSILVFVLVLSLYKFGNSIREAFAFIAWLWTVIEDKEKAKFLLELAKFVATILGATVVLFNIKIAWDNRKLVEEQLDTATFSKSVDQLADRCLATRLGGVFTLEKISRYSEKDYLTSMAVLASFLKEVQLEDRHLKPTRISAANQNYKEFSTEFLTTLKVIERRSKSFDKRLTNKLDLSTIDFSQSNLDKRDFSNLDLQYSNFSHCCLVLSNFSNADLRYADFSHATLSGATFSGANLTHADLSHTVLVKAKLDSVDFKEANLQDADLSDANLKDAILLRANVSGATLLGALGLLKEQLNKADNYDRASTDITV